MSVIEDVQRLLEREVDGESVYALERLRSPLLSLRVEKQKELFNKLEQYRHPKDKDLTDFDRKTMLEAVTADIRAEYELAKGLEELVRERIQLWRFSN